VRFSTAELAAHLGGALVGPDVLVDGAGIDSRTIVPHQLFVPVVAERDGHAFIGAALAAGAAAYLTQEAPEGATAVVVEDTATALMNLGVLARSRIADGVVGITGSVGKTTTKDLLRHCMASTFRTAASELSFNNELGLPLTLVNAPDDAQWVILEMGARGAGHIARLAQVGRPDVGIVTSVAMAHVEFFGGLDGVARAKGELVRALPENGLAILNFDDPRVAAMASFSPCPVLGYGLDTDAEVRAEAVTLDGDLRARFTLVTPWGRGEVRLSLYGLQQVPNALGAAAAALWCGVPFEAVLSSLAEATGSPFRMEVHRPPGGPLLVADCYNANPASTEAALRTLAAVRSERKMALLGLMAELGVETDSEHRRMAALAEELGIEVVGYQSNLYGEAHVDDVASAVLLLKTLGPADAALVKGSRVGRLEDVVERFESESAQT
jgi:UDP-N-acetylmuramoyl-tripeptide--D-alanyl-D-alanine ligase